MRAILIIEHTKLGILNSNNPSNNPQKKACLTYNLPRLQKKETNSTLATLLFNCLTDWHCWHCGDCGQGCCITLPYFTLLYLSLLRRLCCSVPFGHRTDKTQSPSFVFANLRTIGETKMCSYDSPQLHHLVQLVPILSDALKQFISVQGKTHGGYSTPA